MDVHLPLTRRMARILALALGASLVGGLTLPCYAQDVGTYQIQRPHGLLRFRYSDKRDELDRKEGDDQTVKDTLLREKVELSTKGYLYHPRFNVYNISGGLEFAQEKFDDQVRPFDEDSTNTHFNLVTTFLQEHPYSLRLSALRTTTDIRRDFRGHRGTERTRYEAGLRWRNRRFPIELRTWREKFEEEEELPEPSVAYRPRDETEDGVNFIIRREREHIRSRLEYELTDQASNHVSDDFTRHELALENFYNFGRFHQHNLRLSSRYNNRIGLVDSEYFLQRLRARLRHNRKLSTEWFASFRFNEIETAQSYSYVGEHTTRYELFESLFSDYTITYMRSEFSNTNRDTFEFNPQVQYRKRLWGDWQVGVNLSPRLKYTINRGDRLQVTDESHTFSSTTWVELSNQNALIDTIELKKTDGTPLVRGRDYNLRTEVGVTAIDAVPGGNINTGAGGDTILASYTYRAGPFQDLFTTTQNIEAFLTWRYITGTLRYERVEEELRKGIADESVLPHKNTRILRLAATPSWNTMGFNFSTEYESTTARLTPMERFDISGGVNWDPWSFYSTSIGASFSATEDKRDSEAETVFFTWNQIVRLPWNIILEIPVSYNKRMERVGEETDKDKYLDVALVLTWAFRNVDIEARYDYDLDDFLREDRTTKKINVALTRRF